jgi:hypothetical protein
MNGEHIEKSMQIAGDIIGFVGAHSEDWPINDGKIMIFAFWHSLMSMAISLDMTTEEFQQMIESFKKYTLGMYPFMEQKIRGAK